jgi:hypothetical protein
MSADDPDPGVTLQRPSAVNPGLTPKRPRAKRPKFDREPEDKARGIVRQIDAMAVSFIDGNMDCGGLVCVEMIEQATRRLKAAALEGLHGYYSNADIAEALGVSRQAVSKARNRR